MIFGTDGLIARATKNFFYDDGLLFTAYVWAGSFFLGTIVRGDTDWFIGTVFFAQNLSANLCYIKRKDRT